MKEKLHIQDFICNLVITKILSLIIRMHNLYANAIRKRMAQEISMRLPQCNI